MLRDSLAGASGASDLLLPRVDLSRLFPEPACDFVRAHGGEILLNETVRDIEALQQQFSSVILAVGPHQVKYPAPGRRSSSSTSPSTPATCSTRRA